MWFNKLIIMKCTSFRSQINQTNLRDIVSKYGCMSTWYGWMGKMHMITLMRSKVQKCWTWFHFNFWQILTLFNKIINYTFKNLQFHFWNHTHLLLNWESHQQPFVLVLIIIDVSSNLLQQSSNLILSLSIHNSPIEIAGCGMWISVNQLIIVGCSQWVSNVCISTKLVTQQYFHDSQSRLSPIERIIDVLGNLIYFLNRLSLIK